jgi:hypothetical protein
MAGRSRRDDLRVILPVDDPEEVFNLVCDRLLHFQIEEGLPLYLVPQAGC